jgi:hypothetical protein
VASRDIALESMLDGQPPTEQLAAVRRWLDSPTDAHKNLTFATVDHTKQLHFFHEEFCNIWFDNPGMWAVESSEYCVLTLTKDPYSRDSIESLATISVMCAINTFRKSVEHPVREALSAVTGGIQRQLEQAE